MKQIVMKDNAYVRCAFKDSNFKKSVHKLKQRSYPKKDIHITCFNKCKADRKET